MNTAPEITTAPTFLRGRVRLRLLVALSAVALPAAIALAFGTLKLWAAAASDCERFEAGDRFGVLFFTWPALSLGLWATFVAAILVIGRRSLALGLLVGIAIPLVISWQWVAGTREMILAYDFSRQFCPSGLPAWWWDWLPK